MKTRAIFMFASAAVLTVVLAGCMSFKLSGASVVRNQPSYTKVGTFHTEVWVNKFLGGPAGITLFNITADATDGPVYEAIQREIQLHSADAAIEVTVTHKASFVNLLLNGITAGIYAPSTVEVSGTLVKYRE